MAEITMDTDWGARGAQLTGAQVQAFIKGELKKLQEKDDEIEKKVTGGDRIKPDWMESNKESIHYIKNKPEIPTVETIPDENLKSYVNADGTEVNFKIGDFIRVKKEDGKYIFYQINDISEDGSVSWSEAGSGGGGEVDVRETVRIYLSSNQPQPDNALIGAVVTVSDNGGAELYKGEWKGDEIRVKVPPLTEYTISVASIEGYATPEPKNYTSGFQGDRTANMIYNSCLLTVQTSGLQNEEDHTVTVKYGSVNKTINNGQSIKVPVGVSVEVSVSSVEGYATPQKQTFVPQEANKLVTFSYTPCSLKVIIDSNQTDKTDLSSLKATVTFGGSSVNVSSGQVILIPSGVEVNISFPELEGYTKPQDIKLTNNGGLVEKTAIYNSCLLTVQTSGLQNSEAHTITVKYGSTSKTVNDGGSIKVPVGVSVEVTTSSVNGYTTPEKQMFTPQESSKTITLTYIPSSLKVIIDSNQQNKSDLSNLKATVTYNGSLVQVSSGQVVPIPIGVEVRISFPELNGYAKPADITLTNQSGLVEKTGIYKTEAVTVNVSADNSADCSGRKITLTNTATSIVIGTVTGKTGTFKVPFGVSYKVSVDDMEGYDSPSEQSYTANQVTRNVTMQYIYNPIKKGYYIIDDTIKDPATKITLTNEVTEVINWIRKNSHRVLAKKTSEGVCKVIRLLDSDTTKYFDGTTAPITNTNYDVMLMMPEFWYTAESAGTNKWKIWFADGNPEDGKKWHKWDHGHLIGVYEAYNSSNKVYSISGKASTGSVSQADFKQYARNKGKGYQIIDWQAHCIMAFLFYGYYANTNCQAKCGSGTNDYQKQTGQTNTLGMTDTTSANGNSMSINFWGLENWWGNKYEWMDNIVVDARVWKITEADGTVRTAGTGVASDGYASKMLIGDNLDLICQEVSGSETTGYCDYYYQSSSTSRVVQRSYYYSSPNGGVAYAYANGGSSSTYSSYGSRLAFNGTIVEADSVSAFTA